MVILNNNSGEGHSWLKRIQQGSTTVLALMVSMLLMVLVLATVSLTMFEVSDAQDYARNKKTFQAADSGVTHAGANVAEALSSFTIPASTTVDEVEQYAVEASSGIRENNTDISLLEDTADNLDIVMPSYMPRGSDYTFGTTEYNSNGLMVGYQAAVDIEPTSVSYPTAGDITQQHVFHYRYTITAEGDATVGEQNNQATRVRSGTFDVDVKRPGFSTYGYFTNSMKNQFDHQLVFYDGEIYEGPTHVNSAPPEGRAGFWGQPIFNGPFSAVQADYDDSWLGGNADPIFNDSVSWGAEELPVPENGWSQLRAALGDYENIENATNPSNSEMRTLLGLSPSADPVDTGVYYSDNYNGGSNLEGGIFVNGDADSIKLTVSGNDQVMQITMQPADGGMFDEGAPRVWEFHENKSSGQVSVTLDGVAAGTFVGGLNGVVHVEGKIGKLEGDGTLAGADVEGHQEMTISAKGDIVVADHITYEDDPRLVDDATNVLGLFSSNGNIWLAKDAPNGLTMHATVMAASSTHGIGAEDLVTGGGYDYNYPNKGNWNLLGGLIEDKNQTTGVFYNDGHLTGYRWNFDYDERFSEGVAPPYFPYVTKFTITRSEINADTWGRKYY